MPSLNPNRRQLIILGAAALHGGAFALPSRPGRLVVVGGSEDQIRGKVILNRFLELAGGSDAKILIMTAATANPLAVWRRYETAFTDLGATQVSHLDIGTADDANTPDVVSRILSADGVFITGGDQNRLMGKLLETTASRALHTAFHLRGCCIGGTSAGAAAMSLSMLAEGHTPKLPEKDAARLAVGLGFVTSAIIDQHFSERRRLGRLMSVMAQRPDLLGVGIDEDTALVIERGLGIEVIGNGAVTLIDGRHMRTNFQRIDSSAPLEMLGVTMHVLPAGNRYMAHASSIIKEHPTPASLREIIGLLVAPGPFQG